MLGKSTTRKATNTNNTSRRVIKETWKLAEDAAALAKRAEGLTVEPEENLHRAEKSLHELEDTIHKSKTTPSPGTQNAPRPKKLRG